MSFRCFVTYCQVCDVAMEKSWYLYSVFNTRQLLQASMFPLSDSTKFNQIMSVVLFAQVTIPFVLHYLFLFVDAVAFSNAHFGAGTGSQFLDGVSCSGSETMLTSCSSSSTIYCSSGHNEDAGVRCQGKLDTLRE